MAKAKTKAGGVNRDALGRFVGRIEILVEERAGINASLKEIYDEVREAGMDPATVRVMVREKALDPVVRQDQYALRDEYRRALGLFADTELGQAMEPGVKDAVPGDGEARVGASSPAPATRARASEKRTRRARPKPFAKQVIHPPRHERKKPATALDRARAHLGGTPAGSA
jgi:uncharacterized protein (UPF0335 family)